MRIEIVKPTPPPLWIWLSKRNIEGLRAVLRTDGYNETYGVDFKRAGLLGAFQGFVATVDDAVVTLNYPEWSSDFQDLLRQYEKETKVQTTLRICEGH